MNKITVIQKIRNYLTTSNVFHKYFGIILKVVNCSESEDIRLY